MNCPRCGHDVDVHYGCEGGCEGGGGDVDDFGNCCSADCSCKLTEAESLRLAQRQAAALGVGQISSEWQEVLGFTFALRITGVLSENETLPTLLAEWTPAP